MSDVVDLADARRRRGQRRQEQPRGEPDVTVLGWVEGGELTGAYFEAVTDLPVQTNEQRIDIAFDLCWLAGSDVPSGEDDDRVVFLTALTASGVWKARVSYRLLDDEVNWRHAWRMLRAAWRLTGHLREFALLALLKPLTKYRLFARLRRLYR